MRIQTRLEHWYAGVPLLFLLVISPVGILAVSAEPSTTSCTAQQLGREEIRLGSPVTSASVKDFAEASSLFTSASAGYNVTFEGYTDDWKVNNTDCTVTWHDASANFLIQNSQGLKYVLVVSENPETNVIYGITRTGYQFASISPSTTSPTYSGYQIADDGSNPPTTAIDFAFALWYVPTPSAPTGSGAPSCKWNSQIYTECVLATWVGLQNTTYNGNSFGTKSGEVVQTGTNANYTCATSGSPCYSSAFSWTQYLRICPSCSTGGLNLYYLCYFNGHSGSVGDEMEAEVGSQYQVEGTSGNYYDTVIYDVTVGYSCSHAYATTTDVNPPEIYADFDSERVSYYGTADALPKFTSFEMQDLQISTGTNTPFGAYPNYNNGWGMGTYMYNSPTRLTTTSSMSESSGSQGYFTESWDSSYNT